LTKNNGYFGRTRTYICDYISLSSSENEKCFRQNYRENPNTHFMFDNSFPKTLQFMR